MDVTMRRRPYHEKDGYSSPTDSVKSTKKTAGSARPSPSFCQRLMLHCCLTIFCIIIFPLIPVFLVSDVLVDPIPLSLPARQPLTGALLPNNRLSAAKKLYQDKKLLGPESTVYYNNSLYTTIHHGVIVKIENDEITEFARLGPPDCRTVQTCGRPLGLRIVPEDESLLVADAYLGVFQVFLQNKTVQRLFPFEPSETSVFFDDIALLPEKGKILVTEPLQKRLYHELIYSVLESYPLGRIHLIDYLSKTHEILADNLPFPNGIELSRANPDSALFTETQSQRIRRIYWRGSKKGQVEELPSGQMANNLNIAMLPGFPDNIRHSEAYPGTFWVAIVISRHASQWGFSDYFLASPWLKRAVTRALPLPILHFMLHNKYGIIVRVDENGSILETLHDPSGSINSVSDVCEVNKTILFLGSYFHSYMGSVRL